MGASVVLTPERVSVAPGAMATATVRVRNDGSVVDLFSIDVVGETGGWTTVEPPTLNLYPGAQGTVEVRFRPPRSSAVLAGITPFGVRVRSQEDPGFSVVEEGVVDVAPFTELGATLVPQTVETSSAARSRIRLVNAGNVAAALSMRVEDPDEALAASVTPATLALAPGQEATAQVSLRARNTFLRGPARSRPYAVVLDHSGSESIRVTGTFVQKPVISAGWVKLATGLLGLGVVAALFLLTQKDDNGVVSDPTASTQATGGGPETTRGGGNGASTSMGTTTSMATTTTLTFTERPIVFASLEDGPDSDIWAIQPDGSGLRQLTDEDDDETDPALSPDGKRIAFVRDDGGDTDIYVMNVDGSDPENLTDDDDAEDVAPAWSPDGQRIAWASSVGELQIFVMDADGDNPEQITGGQVGKATDPSWSPDGQRLAITAFRTPTNAEIAVVDDDGGTFTYLTNNPAQDARPAWGRDGQIAFESNRVVDYDVWVMEANGSGLRQLTDTNVYDGAPAWSEDAADLAFESARGGQRRIWTMAGDGTDETMVTDDNGSSPSW